MMNEKKLYYQRVWELTEINCGEIQMIEKRGQEFHLDHIIPISFGFRYYIPEEIIGARENLRIVPMKQNLLKNQQITDEVKERLKELNISIERVVPRKIINVSKKKMEAMDFVLSKPKLSTILNTENKKSLLYYLPSNKLRVKN